MAPPPLHTRDDADNMGYAIPPNAIVLLVLLGAGFVIAMLYGMDRMTGFRGREAVAPRPLSAEQAAYMAEVRRRNVMMLCEEAARGRGKERRVEK
ncbi:hypothetical protein PMIN06_007637 [Paraphaeosphaeria minitans]|uniref:Uncharacterized protein n=1 Tax=Paraphaeosphaeria minitans TaxID=565426 RepID=A0A9P6KW25_9PLEO|nr:hypothetical protein PMIN01_00023 [Paraphaeosphaeria minitans]